ncbi:MAG TPA: cytochrome c-type biogenesis CcmF C-terminal domain-containing protein, partial [Stellaceae bacterium]|nr:cytochrome c-type biogenesis CcmF C-terminal domain-containing protein [Stellaceae bacterium]
WGGWWFWDPVENASFMPWLAGTALLHSAIVVEKRDALKSWTLLLAIVTFALALIGTFLVRSGVLTSVHAFALDPARGAFILGLLVIAIGGALVLYAWRAPALKGGGLFAPISREGALVLNNLLLASAAAAVFLGTLYPLFLDATGGPKASFGPPYFNRTFGPLMIAVIVALAAGPLLAWKRGDLRAALQRLWAAFAAAIAVTLIALYVTSGGPVLAVLGLGLAAWLAGGVITEWGGRLQLFRLPWRDSLRRALSLPRSAHGMSLAHLGLAVTIAGIAASAFSTERIESLHVGDRVAISPYELRFDHIEELPGPDYDARRATFTLLREGEEVATLHPES